MAISWGIPYKFVGGHESYSILRLLIINCHFKENIGISLVSKVSLDFKKYLLQIDFIKTFRLSVRNTFR